MLATYRAAPPDGVFVLLAIVLENLMPLSRNEAKGGRAFAVPLLGAFVLIAFYLLIEDWRDLPRIIDSALAAVHWRR